MLNSTENHCPISRHAVVFVGSLLINAGGGGGSYCNDQIMTDQTFMSEFNIWVKKNTFLSAVLLEPASIFAWLTSHKVKVYAPVLFHFTAG